MRAERKIRRTLTTPCVFPCVVARVWTQTEIIFTPTTAPSEALPLAKWAHREKRTYLNDSGSRSWWAFYCPFASPYWPGWRPYFRRTHPNRYLHAKKNTTLSMPWKTTQTNNETAPRSEREWPSRSEVKNGTWVTWVMSPTWVRSEFRQFFWVLQCAHVASESGHREINEHSKLSSHIKGTITNVLGLSTRAVR